MLGLVDCKMNICDCKSICSNRNEASVFISAVYKTCHGTWEAQGKAKGLYAKLCESNLEYFHLNIY